MNKLNNSITTKNNEILDFDDNNWTVCEKDIYMDLKILLDGCFRATMSSDGNRIKLDFDNGQKFAISIRAEN